MKFQLTVFAPNQETSSIPLADGRYQIGSHPQCEIAIPVYEVAEKSAVLDVRGEAVFLRNLNTFPIFIGESELQPGQQTEWQVGKTVLLSQQVTLDLVRLADKNETAKGDQSTKRAQSTMQIAVIVACLALGYSLLTGEESSGNSANTLRLRFTEDLVIPLQEDPRYRDLLENLNEARIADVRWGQTDPKRAIDSYQFLLNHELLRKAADENLSSTPLGRTRTFAMNRVAALSANVKKR